MTDYLIPDAIAFEPKTAPSPITSLCALLALQAHVYEFIALHDEAHLCGDARTNAYKHAVGRLRAASEAYVRARRTYAISVGQGSIEAGRAIHRWYTLSKCSDASASRVGGCRSLPT